MVPGQHSVKERQYAILSVKENESCEEIRASYQSSILSYHLDKLQTILNKSLKIQKAREVLSDAKLGSLHDSELLASRQNSSRSRLRGDEEMGCSISRDGRGMIPPTADNLAVSDSSS
ncbi:hypothetical protein ACJRO7_008747 [Eucalyptus globulus]|uniref:J domain-containing protein n=1 Tax=Eucalyptus globulus TaxID=34317 RepID=A0ABD3IST5_EUCGL